MRPTEQTLLVTATVVGVIAVVVAVFLLLRSRVASHGTYLEMPKRLSALKGSTDPTAFLGFCTRDEDALYFVYANNAFNLDYELYGQQKEKYAEPFRRTASDLGFEVLTTSYDKEHVVLRIQLAAGETEAAEQAFRVAHELFGLEKTTELEFLP
jgi:hypothetical protein